MSRTRQDTPNTGSTAQVETRQQTTADNSTNFRFTGTLRLRAEDAAVPLNAEESEPARRIRWSEDVVDNEGMGKKSSKVCCIYHKPRPVGESSSESESSSSSSSGSDSDSSADSEEHGHCNHHHRGRRPQNGHPAKKRARPRRKPSPNAYEKMPKPSKDRPTARGS